MKMLTLKKAMALALALALLLTAVCCAFGEEEPSGNMRRLRLGSSFYTVLIDDGYTLGEMTDEDIGEGLVGYYLRDESEMDFDVYQFAKDDVEDTIYRYVLEEAMEYDNVDEVRPREIVNDIDVAWYRATEEYEGVDYETLTYILDDYDSFVELVFWTANEEDVAQALAVVDSLEMVGLQEIRLGSSPFTLYVPEDYRQGGLTLEDEEDDQMAYYYSDATCLDFDVYQFGKDGLPEDLAEYAEQEAAEYPVINELVTDAEINGVPVSWYRTVEECDDGEFDTITYIMDTGDEFVEVVFWLDGITAEAEADYIIHNLIDNRLVEEDDEGGPEYEEELVEDEEEPAEYEEEPAEFEEELSDYEDVLSGYVEDLFEEAEDLIGDEAGEPTEAELP